ncbi:MAG: hypothetical protein WAK66_14885, partial [Methylocystis sp.]
CKEPGVLASASSLARLARSSIERSDICICFTNKESMRAEMDRGAARRAFVARKFGAAPC